MAALFNKIPSQFIWETFSHTADTAWRLTCTQLSTTVYSQVLIACVLEQINLPNVQNEGKWIQTQYGLSILQTQCLNHNATKYTYRKYEELVSAARHSDIKWHRTEWSDNPKQPAFTEQMTPYNDDTYLAAEGN